MRRVVAEQIEALSELNAIVRSQPATHDLNDRRPARPAPRAEIRNEPPAYQPSFAAPAYQPPAFAAPAYQPPPEPAFAAPSPAGFAGPAPSAEVSAAGGLVEPKEGGTEVKPPADLVGPGLAFSSAPARARCSSTKSRIFRRRRSARCSAYWRAENSRVSAAVSRSHSRRD